MHTGVAELWSSCDSLELAHLYGVIGLQGEQPQVGESES